MNKSVICHLFYPDASANLLRQLKALDDGSTTFFFNFQGNDFEHDALLLEASKSFKNNYILKTPNKGRDIGAKLLLIELLLQLRIKTDFTLIIHDKKSPHLENGNSWREELFKIIQKKSQKEIFQTFANRHDVGIISSAKYIQNEYNDDSDSFYCNSKAQIKDHLKKFDIKPTNYYYVAGNIFWIRTILLEKFFKTRPILNIRADLEEGNTLDLEKGTYTHAWERIMSWIATSQGYTIYGI